MSVFECKSLAVARKQCRLRELRPGQSAVEVALLLPVLLLMVLGAIDAGRLFFLGIEVNHAARAGVQYGAQNPGTAIDDAGIRTAAISDAADIATLTVSATSPAHTPHFYFCQCDDGAVAAQCLYTDCPGKRLLTFIQVNTSAQFTPLTGVIPATTVSGKAVSRVSNG